MPSNNASTNPKTPLPAENPDQQKRHRTIHVEKVEIITPAFHIHLNKRGLKTPPPNDGESIIPSSAPPNTGNSPPLPPLPNLYISLDKITKVVEFLLPYAVISCAISLAIIAAKL